MDTPQEIDAAKAATLAERVRSACIDAAIQAYEDGGIRGLCGDGRWEYAVSAMRRLDLGAVIAGADPGEA